MNLRKNTAHAKGKKFGSSGHNTKINSEMDLFEHMMSIEFQCAKESIRNLVKKIVYYRLAIDVSNEGSIYELSTSSKIIGL